MPPQGVTVSAQRYSWVESVKPNGREPYAYLRPILERLPLATSTAAEALPPWNCSAAL
ncbi:transposase domain-containing protein [Pseudomonas sp. 2FE]|uniref:transposase domain-containing protein n=1 Tax=Pseudomonas sp. 2FE TaxID=2502190 RepID=UPI0014851C87